MKIGKIQVPLEGILGAACFSFLVIILSAQVILRFGFNRSLAWTEEVSRFAFVWAVYFGFVLAAHEDKHIRVTAALWIFPDKVQRIFLTFADFLWLIFNFVMIYYGIQHLIEMIEYPYMSQTLGFNLLYAFIIIPLGFAWMSVRIIQVAIKRLYKKTIIHDSRLDTI